MTHFQTCLLHDDMRIMRCSGTLKKGGNCIYKAVGSFSPGMMPTCYVHRRQLKRMGWCRAPLRCGSECGRMCEWKLHGFQLCSDHREHPMPCYFLKIPIEMRLRIYQFLLPDRPIPARYERYSLVSDGGGIYTAILCVNHQIHNEAASLLYSTRAFSIELYGEYLSMCNLTQTFTQNRSYGPNDHAPANHPLHQITPGQHDLLTVRPGRGVSSSANTPAIYSSKSCAKSPIFDASVAIEPIWNPPLSEEYFNMIQSFRIEIVLSYPSTWWLPNSNATSQEAAESKLLDHCDHLHRLIARLGITQRPIARLEITIKFNNARVNQRDAFPVAQFLMRPFQRLRNVTMPSLVSIAMQDSSDEIGLLTPDWTSSPAGAKFAAYLTNLFQHMSSSQPPPKQPVFQAYWQLQNLLSYIKVHYRQATPKIEELAGLLHTARFAREDQDITRFKEVWNQVLNIWSDCLHQQAEFQSHVTLSIDAIHSIVQVGP